MPKVVLKALTMLVVPVAFAMIAQTAAAPKPYHARVKDCVAARRQSWNSMSSPNGMPLGGATRRGVWNNDLSVGEDGRPVPYYEINPPWRLTKDQTKNVLASRTDALGDLALVEARVDPAGSAALGSQQLPARLNLRLGQVESRAHLTIDPISLIRLLCICGTSFVSRLCWVR